MHLNGENLKCHLKVQTCRKWANVENIDDSEKYGPKASSALALGIYTIIFKHVYWYI